MAAKKRSRSVVSAGPIAETRARIREAEKASAPVVRQLIGLDGEAFETVAILVERGLGTQAAVLREALATGLRVMRQGSAPTENDPLVFPSGMSSLLDGGLARELYAVPPLPDAALRGAGSGGLLQAVVGARGGFGAAIETPPSVERRESEAETEETVDA